MRLRISVWCEGCDERIDTMEGDVIMLDALFEGIEVIVEEHRLKCPYYGPGKEEVR